MLNKNHPFYKVCWEQVAKKQEEMKSFKNLEPFQAINVLRTLCLCVYVCVCVCVYCNA